MQLLALALDYKIANSGRGSCLRIMKSLTLVEVLSVSEPITNSVEAFRFLLEWFLRFHRQAQANFVVWFSNHPGRCF